MISKKEKKVILISIVSLVLIAAIAITSVFFVRKKKDSDPNVPTTEQVGDFNSNYSNKAIADGVIPYNYNGVYKFNNIKDIEFSNRLTDREIKALYKNKNINNQNELFDLLKKEETAAAENIGELLVFSNGNFNKTIGGDKNPKPVASSAGYYVGNDDLALVKLNNGKKQFYISLNHSSKHTAVQLNSTNESDGTKLYIFETIYSKYDPELALIHITYEYDLHIIEEEINEDIYDF